MRNIVKRNIKGGLDLKAIGRRIREIRGFELNQSEFGKLFDIGQAQLSKYEMGLSVPTLGTPVAKLASKISLSAPTVITYGGSATVGGKLADASDSGLTGQSVSLDSMAYGTTAWTVVGTKATQSVGTFSFSVKPTIKTSYRVRFIGDDSYAAVTSATKITSVRAYLSTPIAPTSARRAVGFTTYGYLKPKHPSGGYPVRIYRYRYVSGKWKSYGYVNARAYNYSTYTKYSVSIKLPYSGRWRLRAYHADSGHAASWSSSYRYVTVK